MLIETILWMFIYMNALFSQLLSTHKNLSILVKEFLCMLLFTMPKWVVLSVGVGRVPLLFKNNIAFWTNWFITWTQSLSAFERIFSYKLEEFGNYSPKEIVFHLSVCDMSNFKLSHSVTLKKHHGIIFHPSSS